MFGNPPSEKRVALIMGSDSDRPLAEAAIRELRALGIPCIVRVLSAHRTPEALQEFVAAAEDMGIGAFICIAGMAAHLAGAVVGLSVLPVVGVPAASGSLNGLDALLATVQMPPGIPVATVAVGGGRNAAILCAQMLAIHDGELRARLAASRQAMRQTVLEKDAALGAELSG